MRKKEKNYNPEIEKNYYLDWLGSAFINSFKLNICTEITGTMKQKYLCLALNTVRTTICT